MLKNIFYNTLGLIKWVFLWSFTGYFFGFEDLFGVTNRLMNATFDWKVMLIPVAIAFPTLLVIGLAQRFVKNFMK